MTQLASVLPETIYCDANYSQHHN